MSRASRARTGMLAIDIHERDALATDGTFKN